ncbi:hypothetical protein E4T56_gene19012 [Termitomyces sp. T112]|nr:hypothetical protein E4T56_gene19012 [Termitomyces sp. T112]
MAPSANLNRSPRSFTPPNDVATYRDLLFFEERLKSNAMNLQSRKSRYQLFLIQLLMAILFLLVEVLLPPQVSILAIPYRMAMRKFLPGKYSAIPDVQLMVHPYFSTGLLFVSVTTLLLFFASGMYEEKISYANKYVPHANRALRSFNMYLNVRKPPLRTKFRFNPLSFFFPRPSTPSAPSSQSLRLPSPSRSLSPSPRRARSPSVPPGASIPIPEIPPASNPRGELIFSSRVDRAFREGYDRHRAAFEKRRGEREREASRRSGTVGWIVGWWKGKVEGSGKAEGNGGRTDGRGAGGVKEVPLQGGPSVASVGRRTGTGRNSKGIVMKPKQRERSLSPPRERHGPREREERV